MLRIGTVFAAVLVAVGLIGGSVYFTSKQSEGTTKSTYDPNKVYSAAELTEFNGKEGKDCLVAVNGKVYKIEQGNLWQDGEHASSEGKAYCGRDLSDVIGQSPHGTSKLETLEIVGTFQ